MTTEDRADEPLRRPQTPLPGGPGGRLLAHLALLAAASSVVLAVLLQPTASTAAGSAADPLAPAATTRSRVVVVRFSLPRHAAAMCRLDAGASRPCRSPYRHAHLRLGAHTLIVRLAYHPRARRVIRWRALRGAPVAAPPTADPGDVGASAAAIPSAFFDSGSPTPPYLRSAQPPVGPPLPTSGRILFVSAGGSDGAAGTVTAPLRTLARASALARPGTTVVIRGGSYGGFNASTSGTPGAPITYTAYPGESVVVAAGTRLSGIAVVELHDLVFRALTMTGATPDENNGGLLLQGSARILLEDSLVWANLGYGINVIDSADVVVQRDAIVDNATGIQVRDVAYWLDHRAARSGAVTIAGNRILDSDRMRTNTPTPKYDDTGAQGIVINLTSGPTSITGNVIAGSTALSDDYGRDGTAIEVFGASNVSIAGNTLAANMTALEVGTQPNHAGCVAHHVGWCWSDAENGGVSPPTANISFTRNLVYSADDKSRVYAATADPRANVRTLGLLFHSGTNVTVTDNTIDGMDNWAFWFDATDVYAAPLVNVVVSRNIITSDLDQAYSVSRGVDVRQLTVGGNLDWNYGGPSFGTYGAGSNTVLGYSAFTSRSGLATTDRIVNPLYVSRFDSAHPTVAPDYRIRAGSPARGVAGAQ